MSWDVCSRSFGRVRGAGLVLLALAVTRPSAATWSIVAADAETQEVVVASATCLPGINMKEGGPVIVVGEGAGAAQAEPDLTGARRRAIWDGLHLGWTATDIVDSVVSSEPNPEACQDGVAEGLYATAATHTGSENRQFAHGVTGSLGNVRYSIQGNVLAGPAVITAAEAAFVATQGDLAARAMAAMEAARAMGGDGRCSCTPGAPTMCGSPPPQFEKSALAGFLLDSRLGDTDDIECDSAGCADGSYFIDLNIAWQEVGDPDPVPQLRSLLDARRVDLIGRPDAITSTVSFSPLGTSGVQWVMQVDLADWQRSPLAHGVDSLTIEHAPGSSQVTDIGPVVYRGGGRYEATLTSDGRDGADVFLVTADDGIRPVVLPPRRAILDTTGAAPVAEAGTVTVSQSGTGQWHAVALTNTYADPVVIMQPPSDWDTAPTTIRVRNVSATGFEFQLDEWDYLDGAHGAESVGYLVVEAGRHTLESGAVLEAGTANVSEAWSAVSFGAAFPSTPVVLSQVTTVNEASAVTTRQQAVTASGFEVRLQEEEAADGLHAAETVAWVAISVGDGQTAGKRFQAGRTPDAVTHEWYTINFTQPFASAPVLLAALQTFDGPDTVVTRSQSPTAGGVQLVIEEEQSLDTEMNHTGEVVGFLAIEAGDLHPNTAPVALDQSTATDEGTSVAITLAANDGEGDALTFAIVDVPQTGTLSGTPPEVAYAPNAGFVGVDSFTFTATDGQSGSNVATVSITVNASSAAGLVAHWPLDEAGGDAAGDATGHGNDGTLVGPAWTGGRIDGGLRFDGADDYVAIQHLKYDQVGAIEAVSVAFWLKTTSEGHSAIVDFDRSEYWSAGLDFLPNSSAFGKLSWDTTDSAGTIQDMSSSARVDDGAWHHVVMVFDAAADRKRIYIDGALDSQHNAHGANVRLGSGATRYGFLGDGSEANGFDGDRNNLFYEGNLDDVRIYHRVLSDLEIDDLFVSEPNHAPEAGDLDLTTPRETAVAVTLDATDPDGDALYYAIIAGPTHGALSGTSPDLTYTPETGYTGQDAFTYKANDGELDSNLATVTILVVASSSSAIGESGTVTIDQADSSQWHTVALNNTYSNPVVIMQPPTFNGSDPATIRIRSVSASSFQFQIDEWECRDGAHSTETMGYLVVEVGEHVLADGTKVKAGTVSAGDALVSVSFGSAFGAMPVVLTQAQTVNEATAVATRQQEVDASGFEVRLQEQEAADGVHAAETVGWIAIDVHGGTSGGLTMEAGRTGDVVYHDWHAISFTQSYAAAPVFLAGMQTTDGPDPSSVRCQGVTTAGAEVFIEEEDSYDSETNHTTEVVGYIALEAGELVCRPPAP